MVLAPGRSRRAPIGVAIAFAASSIGLLAAPAATFAWNAGSFSSASEQQLIALTNQSRANAGRRALKVDSALTSIARYRSKDMITRNYFSHSIPPSGKQVFAVMSERGYCFNLAGENIGWNTYPDDVATAQIHQMFMDSPAHRENIMGRAWEVIGVGAYKGPDGKKMWTVLFADKCGTAPKPTPKPTTKPTAKPAPRPTPRATPKPALATPPATPTPSPLAAAVSAPRARDRAFDSPGELPDRSTPGNLRVDDPVARGLFESIVGGATASFFGS
jgi:uncharacterized protein YkwD